MKKTSFSFRAIGAGGYLHRFFLGKMKRRQLRNAAIGAAAVFCLNTASAQCNTFHDADSANPLLSILSAGKTIAGFAFADIDGDGDQDVYVDFLGKRSDYRDPLYLFKNIGTKTHPVFEEEKNTGFGKFRAGGQNGQMQFVDIDGDGDLDYFASDSTNYYYGGAHIFYYKNIGTSKMPHFEPSSFDALPIFGTRYMQPFQFVDIDGDGDFDLYEASVYPYSSIEAYQQRVYYNIGTPQNAQFDKFVYVEGDGALYRTYYDWNKDGQLDYFASNNYYNVRGNTLYYRHTGSVNSLTYVLDRNTGPVFGNGPLYRIIDLNNDGVPEVFDFNAHYSTIAPLAVIKDSLVIKGGQKATVLYSKYGGSDYTFRWEYQGETMEGSDKNYIVPGLPGKYTLYVTNACGTGVSLDYKYKRNTTLTAENKSVSTEGSLAPAITVKVYPNPFVNSITLQLSGTACTVKITDMAGRILLLQTTTATTLKLGEKLKAGTYAIQVWQEKKMIYKTILVKQ